MSSIQIEGLEKNASEAILDNIRYIQDKFNGSLDDSDKTIITNAIEETRFRLNIAQDNSKTNTYYDKHLIFQSINESWFNLHEYYKYNIDTLELIKTIDCVTNYSIAYSKLFHSLYLINEDRTDIYKDNLEKIVSGYRSLCETIDIFIELFSIEELEQINYGAKNAISVSKRDMAQYFREDLEISNLVIQLRAYSSLIILNFEEHNNKINHQRNKHPDLETQLKDMAEDSEIQYEINAINKEFSVTEMDGLN